MITRFSKLVVVLATLALSLALAPASQAAAPYVIKGNMPTNYLSDDSNNQLAFCKVECIYKEVTDAGDVYHLGYDTEGNALPASKAVVVNVAHTKNGEYSTPSLPRASYYKIAVVYSNTDSDGNVHTGVGYLKLTSYKLYNVGYEKQHSVAHYSVIDTFDKSTGVSTYNNITQDNMIDLPGAPSPKDPQQTRGEAVHNDAVFFGNTIVPSWKAKRIPKGAVIKWQVRGCGKKVVARGKVTKSGTYSFGKTIKNADRKFNGTIIMVATVYQAGKIPRSHTGYFGTPKSWHCS